MFYGMTLCNTKYHILVDSVEGEIFLRDMLQLPSEKYHIIHWNLYGYSPYRQRLRPFFLSSGSLDKLHEFEWNAL